ncbi:MAG: hypothetical protein CBE43_00515 [Rhodopirellula sp. TMED283]|nr:MAG: hypothetical protein CBE43_00515 [Rhodopirellula sp. TMED283]
MDRNNFRCDSPPDHPAIALVSKRRRLPTQGKSRKFQSLRGISSALPDNKKVKELLLPPKGLKQIPIEGNLHQ